MKHFIEKEFQNHPYQTRLKQDFKDYFSSLHKLSNDKTNDQPIPSREIAKTQIAFKIFDFLFTNLATTSTTVV